MAALAAAGVLLDGASRADRPVEFIGLPSVFGDPMVQYARATGRMTPAQEAKCWALERKRQMQGFARFRGHTEKCFGRAHGLSRDYVWGPDRFVVLMAPADVAVLMGLHPRHRDAFRVLDELVVARR